MTSRVKMLKVKIKSLAEEARIIRLEELRALGRRVSSEKRKNLGRGFTERNPDYYVVRGRDAELYGELYTHRTQDVRSEQRSSLLAYAFLRGKTRAACEPKCEVRPDWTRVLKLVEKFGPVTPAETKAELAKRFGEWARAAVPAV